MRRIKTFGLAVAMALALTALVGAGSASATQFRAEFYPTSVTAAQSGSHTLATDNGTESVTCKTATATGTIAEPSSSLTLTPSHSGCLRSGVALTVQPRSCKFVLNSTNSKEPFTGNVDIACSKEGDFILFSVPGCSLRLPAQKALGSVSFANTGKSRNRTITASLSLTGIAYTEIGLTCSAPGTYGGGTYTGTYVISGQEASKEPVGVYLADEQVVVPPLIEAEEYPAVVDTGDGTMGISMPDKDGLPIEFVCNSTGTGQGLLESADDELSLGFKKWSGCTFLGGFTVNMNGCSFVLHPEVREPSYTNGPLGITCPEGKEITFAVMWGLCKVGIPAQSGLTSVKTDNTGAGSSRAIEADVAVTNMKYTQTGSQCTNQGTHEDGVLSGTWDLTGYEYAGAAEVEGGIEYFEGAQQGIWVE